MTAYSADTQLRINSGDMIPLYLDDLRPDKCPNCGGRGFLAVWQHTGAKGDKLKFVKISNGEAQPYWYKGAGMYHGKMHTEDCPTCKGMPR